MRPRLSAALLFLSALALPAFVAPAAPARPHASGVDALTGAPLALSSTSLGGAIEHSAGAAVAPLRDTAAEALEALERRRRQLTVSDANVGQGFGLSIAISGDTAVVGAPAHKVGGNAQQGAAYVFKRVSDDWAQDGDALRASDGAAGDWFGIAVALSGGSALVGAYNEAIGGVAGAGAAYVFGLPSTITASANGHGTISPGGAQTVDYGATPTFAFTPDPGYRVGVVTVDGGAVSATANEYTFPAVVADHAIAVRFAAFPDNWPTCTVRGWKPGWQHRPMRLVFAGHAGPYGIAVAHTEYRLGDRAWREGGSVTVRRQGVTRVRYRAVDVDVNAGAAKSCVVRIHG